jgi:putative SbcD/Mre11-related phosphoesterase
MLELANDIFATDDGLGIYLPELNAICIADLHIGLELALLGEGTYIPVDQFKIMQDNIIQLIKKFKPKTLIINGDFKHEFGRASPQEWIELKVLIKILEEFNVELEIIRGNHDNYLKNILHHSGKDIQEPYYLKSNYLFIHGHQSLDTIFQGPIPEVDWIILAHEHPAIVLYDEILGRHKFKCYLVYESEDYKILVLPAYSPFASGTIMNAKDRKKILSPVLSEITIDEFTPMVVDKGEVLVFPKLKELME